MPEPASAAQVFEKLNRAIRDRDLDALVDCFAEDYASEQPIHPTRRFRGRDQVRKNWSRMFGEIPDFRADVIRSTVDDDLIWAEWHWTGTRERAATRRGRTSIIRCP